MEAKIDIKEMLKECADIQAYLEIDVSDEVEELLDRIRKLSSHMARSGHMLADAKYLQDTERANVYAEYGKTILKMPATISKQFIESQIGEVNYLVNWVERINRSATHQFEGIRSLLSYEKELARISKTGY